MTPNTTNVERTLSVVNAAALIAFVDNTNYTIAPHGDGAFNSKEEALTYINSDDYDPEEPLNVCFEVNNGTWDSVVVTHEDSVWYAEDITMGGTTMCGGTIKSMLEDLHKKSDSTCQYAPVELVFRGAA